MKFALTTPTAPFPALVIDPSRSFPPRVSFGSRLCENADAA
jgi:hypothetical protein